MIDHVQQIFDLPKVKKTFVAKKSVYQESNLSRKGIKCISDNVGRIYFISTIDEGFGVPSYVTEELDYSSIEFIWVELKNNEYKNAAKILQQCIPKPTVIVLDYEDEIKISTALKRKSAVSGDKVIIEEYYLSHLMDMNYLSEGEKEFLSSIKLRNLNYTNLYKMYLELCDKIFLSGLLDVIDFYPANISDIKLIKNKVYSIEERKDALSKIQGEYSRTGSFAHRMQLHIEIVKIKREIKRITEELKGVCGYGKAGYEIKESDLRKYSQVKGTVPGDSNGG